MLTSLPEVFKKLHKIPNPLLLSFATYDHVIELCKCLMGEQHITKIESGNHPDLHLIEPEGKSRFHPIAAIHRMITEVGLPPFEASKQIFVLLEAEKMLPAAANALLKTLEEPLPDTWLVLVTDYPDRLLPTVMSRLNPIQFPILDPGTFDMTPFVSLAERGEWNTVLDSLEGLEEDPNAIFHSLLILAASRNSSKFFSQFAVCVEKGRKALEHNVKLRSVILNLLLLFKAQVNHLQKQIV